MNIPLLNAPSIPTLIPLNEKGFLEVGFAPLYNPGIVVCDKNQANPQDLPIACKGVLIAVDSQKRDVYVGNGGISEKKQKDETEPRANLSWNEYSRLCRVLHKDDTIYKKMPDWDKAILIFDWENDIKLDKSKKESFRKSKIRIENAIDKIIRDEISDLKKILIYKIYNSENWNLKNYRNEVPTSLKSIANNSRSRNSLSPNSKRCRYYVAIVMKLMQEIVKGNIVVP